MCDRWGHMNVLYTRNIPIVIWGGLFQMTSVNVSTTLWSLIVSCALHLIVLLILFSLCLSKILVLVLQVLVCVSKESSVVWSPGNVVYVQRVLSVMSLVYIVVLQWRRCCNSVCCVSCDWLQPMVFVYQLFAGLKSSFSAIRFQSLLQQASCVEMKKAVWLHASLMFKG